MPSTSLFVIGHLKTAGGEARQKVVDAFTKVSKYSAAQGPGVTRFCVAIPREGEGDETSLFAFEEFVPFLTLPPFSYPASQLAQLT
jgi:hypothetical protein